MNPSPVVIVPPVGAVTTTGNVGRFVKSAVTVVSAVTLIVHAAVPEQPPPVQPVNVEPPAGVAVSMIVSPLATISEQVAPQLIPIGIDSTVPVPAPDLATVSFTVDGWNIAL